MSLFVILAIPLLALAVPAVLPQRRRLPGTMTVLGAAAVLGLAADSALKVAAGRQVVGVVNWVALDGFGALQLLAVAFVGATAALFSLGYMGRRDDDARRTRSYYLHFNLFLFSLLLVPMASEPILAWVAIELTALFSVLLVAFDNTHAALEAAWKYITMMFMGAAVALLGFFILFWALQKSGGGPYSWDVLRAAASHMPPVLVQSAFLLILIGLGVEVGLVPLHTWLPDAHSQAPSPACALLSGVKTTLALALVLRLTPLLPEHWVQPWLLAMGLISVGAAAFLLLQVRDYKRLFAFSTVEHMGIIFVAAGIGAAGGNYGAMFQIVTHSLTKSFCFLAAGAALLAVETREIAAVRGLIRTSPLSGVALLLGGLAIAGAPPLAVFLSEFAILKAGLSGGHYAVVGLLTLFIAITFAGILLHVNRMVFGRPKHRSLPAKVSLPASCVAALGLAAVPVLVLGVYLPEPIHRLLLAAAAALTR
ncbi:MAG: proton-conducting transporter membrane subunit [Thermoguttaceae bacterium]